MEIKKVYEVGKFECEKFYPIFYDEKEGFAIEVFNRLKKDNPKLVLVETTRKIIIQYK